MQLIPSVGLRFAVCVLGSLAKDAKGGRRPVCLVDSKWLLLTFPNLSSLLCLSDFTVHSHLPKFFFSFQSYE